MPANGVAIAAGLVGAGLLVSAVWNKSLLATTKNVISGTNPQTAPGDIASGAGTVTGVAPVAPVTASGNVAMGKLLAATYGWSSGDEWNALYDLWERESGWNNLADNASSGAYGIPQALPASKMGAAANPPVSSASAQILWGLSYIKDTYGTPEAAWSHEEAQGWY
jgi:hypothetical protein